MFSVIGEWKDYYFVYDSNDGSCELIECTSLEQSGVVYDFRKSSEGDYWKLRTLFGSSLIFNKLILCFYTVLIKARRINFCLDFELSLRLDLLDNFDTKYHKADKTFFETAIDTQRKYGYSNPYITALQANIIHAYRADNNVSSKYMYKFILDDNSSLSHFAFLYDNIAEYQSYGVLIPPIMFEYTLRLAKSYNLDAIFSVYSGIFSSKLVVRDLQHMKQDYSFVGLGMRDINWRV